MNSAELRHRRQSQIEGRIERRRAVEKREQNEETIHKKFDALIPGFFSDTLTNGELQRFLDHYDTCSECREELSIQYLIHDGLAMMEKGEAFDLEKELGSYVDRERTRLERREWLSRAAALYELITLAAFAVAAVFCIVRFL